MKRLPNRSLPERLSVTLYLHRQAFSASPDGVEPVECQCTVIHGRDRSRVELVHVDAEALQWAREHSYMASVTGPDEDRLNGVIRRTLERQLGRPVNRIPSDRFDEMPLRHWEIPSFLPRKDQARVGGVKIA